MKKFSKVLSLLLVFAMIVPGIAQAATVDAEEAAVVTRISGGNRYQTAANVSNQKFGKSKTVVLASGENWPDALAGTALAGVEGAPILLTAARRLHPDTKAELISLGAEKVIIVGGETVIPAAVADELKAMGLTVDRKEGLKREDTAVAAAKGMTSKTAIIANGYESFADALSAGAYAGMNGMPILFVRQNSVPAGTLEGLKALGIENVIIAGGTSAVSAKVQSELAAYNPTRIYGEVREETSLAFAEKFADNKEVIIANGYDYADALAGAALGAKIGAPVVLVNTNSMKTVVKEFIGENADKNHTVIGGTSAVSNNVMSDIEEIIAPVEEDEFKVVSVSAINAKKLEVTFNKPVNGAYTDKGATNPDNYKVPGLDLTGADYTLQDDEKTVIITLADGKEIVNGTTFVVTVEPIAEKAPGTEETTRFAKTIAFSDTVRPAVKEVKYPKTGEAEIVFTEELKSANNVYVVAPDHDLNLGGVSTPMPSGSLDGDKITFTGLQKDVAYTVTIVGAEDWSENLITPNPTVVTLKNTLTADKVAPILVSATAISNEVVEFKFSEEVPTLDKTKIKYNGAALAETDTVAHKQVDGKTDKTVVVVTLNTSNELNVAPFTFEKDAVKDVADNGNAAFTQMVRFDVDKTGPILVKQEVKAGAAGQPNELHLTFNEEVATISGDNLTFKYVDEYGVDKTVTVAAPSAKSGDAKVAVVKLQDSEITSTELSDKINYTVEFAKGYFKDGFGNDSAAFTVKVNNVTDAVTSKLAAPTIQQKSGKPGVIEVIFTQAVNPTEARNLRNYAVEGATIEKVSLVENTNDGTPSAKIELHLADNSIKQGGNYNVTVKGISGYATGVTTMDSLTTPITLTENVRPTVTAKVKSFGTDTVVDLTFSENVKSVNDVTTAYELYIGGIKQEGVSVKVTTDGTTAGTATIVGKNLNADYAAGKVITLEYLDTNPIQDTNNNPIVAADVVVK